MSKPLDANDHPLELGRRLQREYDAPEPSPELSGELISRGSRLLTEVLAHGAHQALDAPTPLTGEKPLRRAITPRQHGEKSAGPRSATVPRYTGL
jgi:hypothetical protein